MKPKSDDAEWILVEENREAVIQRLERGEVDGILPASSSFLDGFCSFLSQHGLFRFFGDLPDGRKDPHILPAFFAIVLLCKAIFRISSLRQTPKVLFQSPEVMTKMGVNARLVATGAYPASAARPFTMEALANYMATISTEEFVRTQLNLASELLRQFPWLIAEGTLIMDCHNITIPPGPNGRQKQEWEACVLGTLVDRKLIPPVWTFVKANTAADIAQRKALLKRVLHRWQRWPIKRILIDRGFLDGNWMSTLKNKGLDTIIGLKSDMLQR